MAKNLLIVESPAKARTINKYLGNDFQVLASYGHVRDLKPKEGAVDTAHGFAMHYELIERNKKHVDAIARAAKSAEAIYLATDRDREGEAISWHVYEILKERGLTEGKAVHRVVFSEITPRAIRAAVEDPHPLSHDLVDAQQARRALDYLVGFNLSPVLWRKIQRGLSAGRVQSPALRMIVEREEEIEAFDPREYWTIEADLAHAEGAFRARLTRLDGKKFEQFDLTDEAGATTVREHFLKAAAGRLRVAKVTRRERKRRPAAPFITSTLQQEAARKLGFTTRRTMRVAQSLYEGIALGGEGNVGLITYMRTDSTALAEEALGELRQLIEKDYGAEALPESAQRYRTKSRNAQEAHEAIRPTSAMRRPSEVAAWLTDDQRRLYELVWQRTVASQMIHATLNTVAVDFPLEDANFRATGTTVVTPGFLAVYEEGRDGKGDEDAKPRLPKLAEGEEVPLTDILADQHFTEPPPRYSEASLVKALEEYGIGRPSTYASIIGVLLDRDYVILDSRRFKPTDVGRTVGKFLAEHFNRYVDYEFTARLEEELDAVSNGDEAWVPLLERFWQPFKQRVEEKIETVDRNDASAVRALGTDPESGKPISVKLGRYGPYAQIGTREDEEKPRFASLPAGYSLHTITLEEALQLFTLPRELGAAADGETISAGIGRFGPFVRKGKVYASLKKEDDPYTIELPRGKELIEARLEYLANRIIHDFGNGVQILNGRYGPYITDGEKNARIPKDRDPKSLGLDECTELLAAAPVRKRGRKKKATTKKAPAKKTTRKKKTGARKKAGSKKKKSRARKTVAATTDEPASST
ncbi:MAG: DNA topoisomerase I [Gammaproteobacteria bacterium]